MTDHQHGYWRGYAPGTYDTDTRLAAALVEHFGVGPSVLDLGCGAGGYVSLLREAGVNAVGVDGNPEAVYTNPYCGVQDLAEPFSMGLFDWVLSLEVGEHIPAEFQDVFLDNVAAHCRSGCVLSWAVPGQGGRGHHNCRPNEWVEAEMIRRGFVLDEKAKTNLRSASTFGYFKNTVMAFVKDPQRGRS